MREIITNVAAELLTISIITIYFLLTNLSELLKKLGFTKTQIDIPFDTNENLLLIVKARDSKVYVFPQTSKTQNGWDHACLVNAGELGLPRHLYSSKKFLGFMDASRISKKSYQVSFVKFYKAELDKAVKAKTIPWKYNAKKKIYILNSVDYSEALLLSPKKAIMLLDKNAKLGTRVNYKRSGIYKKGFKKLEAYLSTRK